MNKKCPGSNVEGKKREKQEIRGIFHRHRRREFEWRRRVSCRDCCVNETALTNGPCRLLRGRYITYYAHTKYCIDLLLWRGGEEKRREELVLFSVCVREKNEPFHKFIVFCPIFKCYKRSFI